MPYTRLRKFIQAHLHELSPSARKHLAETPPVAQGYGKTAGEKDKKSFGNNTAWRRGVQTHAYDLDTRENAKQSEERPSRRIGKGHNPCWICGNDNHFWKNCFRMKKGKCSCCGSEAHLTRDCAQRYYPDPSVPRPQYSSSSSSFDNNRPTPSNNQNNSNRNARRFNNRKGRNQRESNEPQANELQTSSSSTSSQNSENEIQRSSVIVHDKNSCVLHEVSPPQKADVSAFSSSTTSKIVLAERENAQMSNIVLSERESAQINQIEKTSFDSPLREQKDFSISPRSTNALALATHCVNKWPTNWHPWLSTLPVPELLTLVPSHAPPNVSLLYYSVRINCAPTTAMVDTGASHSFVTEELVKQLKLPVSTSVDSSLCYGLWRCNGHCFQNCDCFICSRKSHEKMDVLCLRKCPGTGCHRP